MLRPFICLMYFIFFFNEFFNINFCLLLFLLLGIAIQKNVIKSKYPGFKRPFSVKYVALFSCGQSGVVISIFYVTVRVILILIKPVFVQLVCVYIFYTVPAKIFLRVLI